MIVGKKEDTLTNTIKHAFIFKRWHRYCFFRGIDIHGVMKREHVTTIAV